MKAINLISKLIYPTPKLDAVETARSFEGRWVVITGASHGIGEALVRRLISAGALLCLIARDKEQLEKLCERAKISGCEAQCWAQDLYNRDHADQLFRVLRVVLPRVDYLFCNAGKSIHRDISVAADATDRMHDYDRTMELNYRAHVALTLALLPLLEKSGGHVIYTSSVSTLYPPAPGWSAYHASKCAANTWYGTARTELSRKGISVQVAYMPLVHTAMADVNPAYRDLPGYTADEAACQLLKLSLSRRYSYKPWWARLSAPLANLFAPIVKRFY